MTTIKRRALSTLAIGSLLAGSVVLLPGATAFAHGMEGHVKSNEQHQVNWKNKDFEKRGYDWWRQHTSLQQRVDTTISMSSSALTRYSNTSTWLSAYVDEHGITVENQTKLNDDIVAADTKAKTEVNALKDLRASINFDNRSSVKEHKHELYKQLRDTYDALKDYRKSVRVYSNAVMSASINQDVNVDEETVKDFFTQQ